MSAGAALAPLPFYLPLLTPLALLVGLWRGGAWTFLGYALVLFLLPLLDHWLGLDTRATAPEGGPRAQWRGSWDLPLWAWVVAQLALTPLVLAQVGRGGWSALEWLGLALSLGVLNGAGGITVAHELMHRPGRVPRAAAELLMTLVSYAHFCVEHVHGHHRRVATPHDPATARRGESIYRFYRRCVAGSLASAWRLERARVARLGRRRPGLHDARLRQPLLLFAAHAGVALAWGPRAWALFALQSLCGFSLLEVINYLEHYGLQRRQQADGSYERVRPEHSWNSPTRLSNWYLFNLARHSDHHAHAARPYEHLRHRPEAPQLPAGYGAMMLLALVPPLWFRVMDPLVDAWERRQAGARR